MLNAYLPAIVSLGILVGAFLFAWISDVRRIQRLSTPERDDRNMVIDGQQHGDVLTLL
jgi:HAMP domain-containing protein